MLLLTHIKVGDWIVLLRYREFTAFLAATL